ncbi:tyrosine-type recombinase/integrase [Caballeronia sp. 15715]|uniref:tyrosine-type recombinase/integrase n=1 Tax=Caballeronia sp. 15715 TaxID=3391030 RepID=UPI0039E31E71
MSLFKRSSSRNWYYKLYPPGGGPVLFGSTGTDDKAKAQEFHDRLKADLWDQAKLGHKPRYTWNEAVIRYVADRDGISSLETTKTHLRWLDRHLSGVELRAIDRAMIHTIAHAKRSEQQVLRTLKGEKPRGKTVSAGTVNRVIGVLNAVLNAAVEWEWIDRAPVVKRAKVAAKRVRWLTPEEATALLAVLPVHLADMAQFSLETGLRRSNVTGLQWSQVDLVRRLAWIHPDQAKARRAIAVPLSDSAVTVLRRQVAKKRKPEFTASVFVYRGRPVYQTVTQAWRDACAKAGIRDFRWHDLRHTWASWHVQRGTPMQVIKELGGWETLEMVQRYAHLSADHLGQWVQSMTEAPAQVKLAAV